jgi:hypothetical protein
MWLTVSLDVLQLTGCILRGRSEKSGHDEASPEDEMATAPYEVESSKEDEDALTERLAELEVSCSYGPTLPRQPL